jgi:hypothetical protein
MIAISLQVVGPPLVTLATVVAVDTPGTFLSQHPDAAQWLVASMISLTCLMAINSYRKFMAEIRELKQMSIDGAKEIAVIKQICKDREELCRERFTRLNEDR